MTDEVGRAGAARQLRAERAARQRPRAVARDAHRCTSGSSARSRRAALLDRGAGVPPVATPARAAAPQPGWGSPRRSSRCCVAYAKIALDRGPGRHRALPDEPWFAPTLRGYFPQPLRRALRRPARRPPAAPRDHHDLRGQRDGQPGRHHVRLPRRGGDRRRRRAGGPRLHGRAARCSACADFWRAVEALDNRVDDRRADRAVPGRSAGCSTGRCAGSCRPGPAGSTSAPRSSASRRCVAELEPRLPELLVGDEHKRCGRPAQELRPPGRARSRWPLRGAGLLDVVPGCSTSPRSRAATRVEPARGGAGLLRRSPTGTTSTRMLSRITALPRATAGRRWPGRRCATTSTRRCEALTVAVLTGTPRGRAGRADRRVGAGERGGGRPGRRRRWTRSRRLETRRPRVAVGGAADAARCASRRRPGAERRRRRRAARRRPAARRTLAGARR